MSMLVILVYPEKKGIIEIDEELPENQGITNKKPVALSSFGNQFAISSLLCSQTGLH
jgi:hypothetical protein